MRLIKLTRSSTGGEVYVNPNWIVDIFSDEDRSLIALPMNNNYISVLESPESIANMIMSGEEQPTIGIPVRKVGEWIITEHHSNYDDWDDYTCPFCRKTFSRIYGARFCPSCGAKLLDKDTDVRSKGESDA